MKLERNQLSESELRLLSALNIFSKPVMKEIIHSLIEMPVDKFEPMIDSLEHLGWLKRQDGLLSLTHKIPKLALRTIETFSSPDRLNPLLGRLHHLVESQKASPASLIIPLKKAGRENEAATVAYECATQEIEGRNFENAMEYCTDALSVLTTKSGDENSDRLLVKATLTFSDLCQRLRRDYAKARDLIQVGMDAALRLGDQRNVALCHLHMGRAYGLAYMNKEAIDSFSLGLAHVNKLGDKDIIKRSADFCAHYYFLKGLFREAADYCEMALSSVSLGKDHVPDVLTPILLALSSVVMGQFYRAIGVIDSSWRRALVNSDYSLASYYRTYLGQILIMTGRIDEGASHLHAAEKEAFRHNDLYTIVWVRRTLAYYYYLKGEPRESYGFMKSALNVSRTLGLRRPFYSLPWILELLFYYQQKGYASIADYEFEKEIQLALEGPNTLLRGTALRILAYRAQNRKEDLSKTEALFLESESELVRSGASIELAKTRVEIALIKLKQGEKDAACELALKAWEGWPSLNQGSFPNELKSLIESNYVSQVSQLTTKDSLTRYLEMVDVIIPSGNLDDMFIQLIGMTCQFFEAERGGLFSLKEGIESQRYVLEAGYNLTPEQINSEEFRTNLITITRAFKSNEPLIVSGPKSTSASARSQVASILCLPFELTGQPRRVLYYEKSYFDGTFASFNKTVLSQIGKSLGNYVDRIYNYCMQTEVQSREALTNMTVNSKNGVEVFEGLSEVIQDLISRAEMVARSDVPVLILGETGAGKELLAKRIHLMSARKRGPFVAINPSCITESLVESELFGHEKGAFTGADREKPGRMELAHKGTLFIDEVGEIPKSIQVKLLRALEEKSFVRVGGVLKRDVDFRLITATNRDLVREVEAGNFRQDLYYRLCVVTLEIPPLRHRGDDVIKLTQEFLSHYAKRYNRPVHLLTMEEKSRLKTYHWPGNVRELKNVIEQSVIMSNPGKLELTIPRAPNLSAGFEEALSTFFAKNPTIDDLQRRYIKHILDETHGKIGGNSGAAKILGLKRTTLYKRMKKLGLNGVYS